MFVTQSQPMYNLTVAEAHTFFVGDGQWLVHNSGCWKVGDPIDTPNEDGSLPTWDEAKDRYWKNRAETSPADYSEFNLKRMRKSNAPMYRAKVRDLKSGDVREEKIFIELHHIEGRKGVDPITSKPRLTDPDNLFETWPWDHELIDQNRITRYEFVEWIDDPFEP